MGVLSSFLALAIGPFFLLMCLLAAILSTCANLAELNSGFKHEWIRFLELEQHFLAVLGLSKTARELLDRLEHLEFELRVSHNSNGLLEDIVSELVGNQARHNGLDAQEPVSRLESKISHQVLVVPKVGALEDLVDLISSLIRLEALFNDIRRKFELTETDEITSDEIEDLVIAGIVLELEHILH